MRRFWFYRPQWYWFGWRTLIPVLRGHDEFHRWTVILGWTITGRIIIAGRVHDCGDDDFEEN